MALPEELNKLLESGVHFGHKAKRWNPKMEKFIFGKRRGIYVIDLEKTLERIKQAQDFLGEVIKEGRDILFVGTKKQAQGVVSEIAKSYKMPYVVNRWVGGFLTNAPKIRERVDKYKKLVAQRDNGEFEKLPKKEVVWLNKELDKMHRNFFGVKDMDKLPGALVIVDPNKEILAVKEAHNLGIPIVSIIDTDSDPRIIDYPIPGNDDALRSIRMLLSFLMDPLKEIIESQNQNIEAEKAEEDNKEDSEGQATQDSDSGPAEKDQGTTETESEKKNKEK